MLFDGGSVRGRFHTPPNVRNICRLAMPIPLAEGQGIDPKTQLRKQKITQSARARTTFLDCRSQTPVIYIYTPQCRIRPGPGSDRHFEGGTPPWATSSATAPISTAAYPDDMGPKDGFGVQPLRDSIVAGARSSLFVVLLVRATGRKREFAIRAAMGAGLPRVGENGAVLQRHSGVEISAFTCCLPLEGGNGLPFNIIGRPPAPKSPWTGSSGRMSASPGYFAVFHVTILRGRDPSSLSRPAAQSERTGSCRHRDEWVASRERLGQGCMFTPGSRASAVVASSLFRGFTRVRLRLVFRKKNALCERKER